jgi:hypothetical protein
MAIMDAWMLYRDEYVLYLLILAAAQNYSRWLVANALGSEWKYNMSYAYLNLVYGDDDYAPFCWWVTRW